MWFVGDWVAVHIYRIGRSSDLVLTGQYKDRCDIGSKWPCVDARIVLLITPFLSASHARFRACR